MTAKEQRDHCKICDFHNIISLSSGVKIIACHFGEYKNHPVWGIFKCPLGDGIPVRKETEDPLEWFY